MNWTNKVFSRDVVPTFVQCQGSLFIWPFWDVFVFTGNSYFSITSLLKSIASITDVWWWQYLVTIAYLSIRLTHVWSILTLIFRLSYYSKIQNNSYKQSYIQKPRIVQFQKIHILIINLKKPSLSCEWKMWKNSRKWK